MWNNDSIAKKWNIENQWEVCPFGPRGFYRGDGRYHHPQDYFHNSTSVALIKYRPGNLFLRRRVCYNHSYCFPGFCIQTTQTVPTFTSWGRRRRISSAATPHLCASTLRGSATVRTTAGTTRTRPTARVSPRTNTLVAVVGFLVFF